MCESVSWREHNGRHDVQEVGEGRKEAAAKRVAAKAAKPRQAVAKGDRRLQVENETVP
jgi:hypothetical protein